MSSAGDALGKRNSRYARVYFIRVFLMISRVAEPYLLIYHHARPKRRREEGSGRVFPLLVLHHHLPIFSPGRAGGGGARRHLDLLRKEPWGIASSALCSACSSSLPECSTRDSQVRGLGATLKPHGILPWTNKRAILGLDILREPLRWYKTYTLNPKPDLGLGPTLKERGLFCHFFCVFCVFFCFSLLFPCFSYGFLNMPSGSACPPPLVGILFCVFSCFCLVNFAGFQLPQAPQRYRMSGT